MNRVQCGCWGLTYPIGMFTVHDSVPLSLHLQEWSLVSYMAVWVEEGGEHDPCGEVCSVTVAQNRR